MLDSGDISAGEDMKPIDMHWLIASETTSAAGVRNVPLFPTDELVKYKKELKKYTSSTSYILWLILSTLLCARHIKCFIGLLCWIFNL